MTGWTKGIGFRRKDVFWISRLSEWADDYALQYRNYKMKRLVTFWLAWGIHNGDVHLAIECCEWIQTQLRDRDQTCKSKKSQLIYDISHHGRDKETKGACVGRREGDLGLTLEKQSGQGKEAHERWRQVRIRQAGRKWCHGFHVKRGVTVPRAVENKQNVIWNLFLEVNSIDEVPRALWVYQWGSETRFSRLGGSRKWEPENQCPWTNFVSASMLLSIPFFVSKAGIFSPLLYSRLSGSIISLIF